MAREAEMSDEAAQGRKVPVLGSKKPCPSGILGSVLPLLLFDSQEHRPINPMAVFWLPRSSWMEKSWQAAHGKLGMLLGFPAALKEPQ